MNGWQIGIYPWIIADGNYGDFEVGQVSEFAIEFSSSNLEIVKPSQKKAEYLKDNKYNIIGEVLFSNEEALVIDFDLLAYREVLTKHEKVPKVGDFVRGEVALGIDPFFYFERLHALSGIPPIIYTWKIEKITRISSRLNINKGKIMIENGVVSYKDETVEPVDNTRTYPKDFKHYLVNEDGTIEEHAPASKTGALVPNYSVFFCLHCTKLQINPKYQRSKF